MKLPRKPSWPSSQTSRFCSTTTPATTWTARSPTPPRPCSPPPPPSSFRSTASMPCGPRRSPSARPRFRAEGTMRGEFDFFYTYSLLQAGGEFGADITTNGKIDIDGTGEGTYLSDGLSNLTFSLVKDGVSLTDETYINGQKLDASVFGSVSGGYGFASGDKTVYSCDAEAGELLISVAPQANLPPIQYDRVSTEPT